MNSSNKKIIFFLGGLTAGPVGPLLAVARKLYKTQPEIQSHFVDVRNSALLRMVYNNEFVIHKTITGKFRRYISVFTIFLPLLMIIGIIHATYLLVKYRPALVVGAGGFVQVPFMWLAWLLNIPRLIHQQDLSPTLSNKLCSAVATKITVSFEKSLKDFSEGFSHRGQKDNQTKIFWTGNPSYVQPNSEDKNKALNYFDLHSTLPVVLVMGGGGGAAAINRLVHKHLPQLTKISQVIHSTGPGKGLRLEPMMNYHDFEFITDMDKAYTVADVVISRAGVGAITELSAYAKSSIIIPMPYTHQEKNATFLSDRQAAIVMNESEVKTDKFIKVLREIFFSKATQLQLTHNMSELMPKHATERFVAVVNTLLR